MGKKIKNNKFIVRDYHTLHMQQVSFFINLNRNSFNIRCEGRFWIFTISKFDRSHKVPLQKFILPLLLLIRFFYGRITGLLGFEPMKHEGKITGLAAFGNYKKSIDIMKKMIDYKNGEIKANLSEFYKPFFKPYSDKLKKLSKVKKEDIIANKKHLKCLVKILSC